MPQDHLPDRFELYQRARVAIHMRYHLMSDDELAEVIDRYERLMIAADSPRSNYNWLYYKAIGERMRREHEREQQPQDDEAGSRSPGRVDDRPQVRPRSHERDREARRDQLTFEV